MKFSSKEKSIDTAAGMQQIPAPAETQQDKAAKKLREEQTQRRAAEQRADELTKQLSTATMEIMRLKAEIYDLTHGLA